MTVGIAVSTRKRIEENRRRRAAVDKNRGRDKGVVASF